MKSNMIFKSIAIVLSLLILLSFTGCNNQPIETDPIIKPYKINVNDSKDLIARPMIAISNPKSAAYVFTDSKTINGNLFSYLTNEEPYESMDGSGIVTKAENIGTSMMFNLSKLTTYQDLIEIGVDDSLYNDQIRYAADNYSVSFSADKFSMVQISFGTYYVFSEFEAGGFTYIVSWNDNAGNIKQSVTIEGKANETIYIECYHDGEKFIIQSDKDIIDPRITTCGIRSSEYGTTTAYPYSASRYEIVILEDGTAEITPGETGLVVDETPPEDFGPPPDGTTNQPTVPPTESTTETTGPSDETEQTNQNDSDAETSNTEPIGDNDGR